MKLSNFAVLLVNFQCQILLLASVIMLFMVVILLED